MRHSAYHIDVEDGGASSDVVLIEHTFKLVVCKLGALLEAISTPWLISAALVFDKLVKSVEIM